jgi:hypothetical protein
MSTGPMTLVLARDTRRARFVMFRVPRQTSNVWLGSTVSNSIDPKPTRDGMKCTIGLSSTSSSLKPLLYPLALSSPLTSIHSTRPGIDAARTHPRAK